MGREPGSRSAAACLALGDNILSVPRKRERTVLRGVPPPRKFLTYTRLRALTIW